MTTTIHDLEEDIPQLEWSLKEYWRGSFDDLKKNNLDRLLKGIVWLHLSDTMKDIPINTILSELTKYIQHKDTFLSLQKVLIEFDFYKQHINELNDRKKLLLDYQKILEEKITSEFTTDQDPKDNKAYAMFLAKLKSITHAIASMDHLISYKDRTDYNAISGNITSLQQDTLILKDLQKHISSLWLDGVDHPILEQLNDFIVVVDNTNMQKIASEHRQHITNIYNTEQYIEGGLIPYTISSYDLDVATQWLHTALWLNKPSPDVKKLSLLQNKLLETEDYAQKLDIFAQIQDLYISLYHKLSCVYSSNKEKIDVSWAPQKLVLSPKNSAYQLASVLKDLLDKTYTDAQKIKGSLDQKPSRLKWLFDSEKDLREKILLTIKTYYPQYKAICDILDQHNQGVQGYNAQTLEQLQWMDVSYEHANSSYAVSPLSSQAVQYFKQYIN